MLVLIWLVYFYFHRLPWWETKFSWEEICAFWEDLQLRQTEDSHDHQGLTTGNKWEWRLVEVSRSLWWYWHTFSSLCHLEDLPHTYCYIFTLYLITVLFLCIWLLENGEKYLEYLKYLKIQKKKVKLQNRIRNQIQLEVGLNLLHIWIFRM